MDYISSACFTQGTSEIRASSERLRRERKQPSPMDRQKRPGSGLFGPGGVLETSRRPKFPRAGPSTAPDSESSTDEEVIDTNFGGSSFDVAFNVPYADSEAFVTITRSAAIDAAAAALNIEEDATATVVMATEEDSDSDTPDPFAATTQDPYAVSDDDDDDVMILSGQEETAGEVKRFMRHYGYRQWQNVIRNVSLNDVIVDAQARPSQPMVMTKWSQCLKDWAVEVFTCTLNVNGSRVIMRASSVAPEGFNAKTSQHLHGFMSLVWDCLISMAWEMMYDRVITISDCDVKIDMYLFEVWAAGQTTASMLHSRDKVCDGRTPSEVAYHIANAMGTAVQGGNYNNNTRQFVYLMSVIYHMYASDQWGFMSQITTVPQKLMMDILVFYLNMISSQFMLRMTMRRTPELHSFEEQQRVREVLQISGRPLFGRTGERLYLNPLKDWSLKIGLEHQCVVVLGWLKVMCAAHGAVEDAILNPCVMNHLERSKDMKEPVSGAMLDIITNPKRYGTRPGLRTLRFMCGPFCDLRRPTCSNEIVMSNDYLGLHAPVLIRELECEKNRLQRDYYSDKLDEARQEIAEHKAKVLAPEETADVELARQLKKCREHIPVCVVCSDVIACMVHPECGHLSMCQGCCNKFVAEASATQSSAIVRIKCPVCRVITTKGFVKVWISTADKELSAVQEN